MTCGILVFWEGCCSGCRVPIPNSACNKFIIMVFVFLFVSKGVAATGAQNSDFGHIWTYEKEPEKSIPGSFHFLFAKYSVYIILQSWYLPDLGQIKALGWFLLYTVNPQWLHCQHVDPASPKFSQKCPADLFGQLPLVGCMSFWTTVPHLVHT